VAEHQEQDMKRTHKKHSAEFKAKVGAPGGDNSPPFEM